MSQPVSSCMQIKAIVDKTAYKKLMEIYKENHLMGGHYTIFGCSHTPSCSDKHKITEDMIKEYEKKVGEEWVVFMEEHDKGKCRACMPDVGLDGVSGA